MRPKKLIEAMQSSQDSILYLLITNDYLSVYILGHQNSTNFEQKLFSGDLSIHGQLSVICEILKEEEAPKENLFVFDAYSLGKNSNCMSWPDLNVNFTYLL